MNQNSARINLMKKLLYLLCTFTVLFSFASFAQAQTTTGNILSYPEGTCKDVGGGQLWQQNADGTWSPPNDTWNRCQNQGINQGLINQYSAVNPWLAGGANGTYNQFQRTDQYAYGTNYPGGYTNSQDYFLNCVLVQSIVANPACQGFPRYGSQYPNTGFFGNPTLVLNANLGNNLNAAVAITLPDKIKSTLSRVMLGWTLGSILQ
jgi:hypothetical protein